MSAPFATTFMSEIVRDFEQMAVRFDTTALVGLGVTAVLLGLFVWLGGMAFGRSLVAVIGAAGGGVCGFFMTGRNIMPAMVWAAAAVVIALVLWKMLTGGYFFWRLFSAVFCSASGTILVFAGMTLLLLYKGAAPAKSIAGKQSFYLAVVAGMFAFGTVEQLLLCRRFGKKPLRKKQADKDKEEISKAPQSWRTS
jgi:hypothetical protein